MWTALGPVAGLEYEQGLVDNSPLVRFLTKTMYDFEKLEKRISLGAVNVDTGEFTVFDQTNTYFTDMVQAAVSSSSIPGVFPPHVWHDGRGTFMDGGTVYNTNVNSAILQCLEVVDDESKITIDVFVCDAADDVPIPEDPTSKTISNILRSQSIGQAYSGVNNLSDAMRAHPDINYRYLVYQDENKASGISEI